VTSPSDSVTLKMSATSQLPAFQFSPATVDFGTVIISKLNPIPVTITNVGNRPYPTSSVVLNDSSFWVENQVYSSLPVTAVVQ
jgi:hypothetical protein